MRAAAAAAGPWRELSLVLLDLEEEEDIFDDR
jgi:hypothetical protein